MVCKWQARQSHTWSDTWKCSGLQAVVSVPGFVEGLVTHCSKKACHMISAHALLSDPAHADEHLSYQSSVCMHQFHALCGHSLHGTLYNM